MFRAVSVAPKANIGKHEYCELGNSPVGNITSIHTDGAAKHGLAAKLLLAHSKRDNPRGKQYYCKLCLDPKNTAG